jgi:hypothetical protein
MRARLSGLALVVCLLAGCDRHDAGSIGLKSPGRYSGIGTFDAGKLWSQMIPPASKDPAAAKLADDEHVIVVLDSHTGEVRQCGDHSGYCVSMNPWDARVQMTPVKLGKHADELDSKAGQAKTDKPSAHGAATAVPVGNGG